MSEEKVIKEATIKVIGSYLPIITVVLIALGLFKQIIYYTNFNVPIKYFIGISELGLLFSGDLIIVFFAIVLSLLFSGIGLDNLDKKSQNLPISLAVNVVSKQTKRLRTILATISIVFFVGCVVTFFLVPSYSIRIGLVAFFIFSFYAAFTALKADLFIKYKLVGKNLDVLNGLLVLFCLVFPLTSIDIVFVEKGKYHGTVITTTDSTYVSSDSSYFIGKTEKYVFIYNKKNKKTRIIPSESVTSIDMSSK